MNNEFTRNPGLVHIMGVNNNHPYIKKTMVFIGNTPVKKAIADTHKQWIKRKTINNSSLKSYYGSDWKEKLGFVVAVVGSQDDDEILDLGDELDQIDLFDVGDAFDVEPEKRVDTKTKSVEKTKTKTDEDSGNVKPKTK